MDLLWFWHFLRVASLRGLGRRICGERSSFIACFRVCFAFCFQRFEQIKVLCFELVEMWEILFYPLKHNSLNCVANNIWNCKIKSRTLAFIFACLWIRREDYAIQARHYSLQTQIHLCLNKTLLVRSQVEAQPATITATCATFIYWYLALPH